MKTFVIEATGGVTPPFSAPGLFTGHVYVHGLGGNEQAIFAVGSDGNAQFTLAGGFVTLVGQGNMPNITLEYLSPGLWRLNGVPRDGKTTVTLIGIGAD